MKPKLTPEEFIKIAMVLGSPQKAVSAISPLAWPDFLKVQETAEAMADRLECNDKNISRHADLTIIAMWAGKRIR